jgi:hypothetical protein
MPLPSALDYSRLCHRQARASDQRSQQAAVLAVRAASRAAELRVLTEAQLKRRHGALSPRDASGDPRAASISLSP